MNKVKWQLTLALITLFLGFVIAVQFRSQQELNSENYPTRRVGDLLLMLQETEKRRDELAMEVSNLRQKILDLAATNSPEMQEEIEKARILAGLTTVTGKGIEIVLTETIPPLSVKGAEATDFYSVQPDDLSMVINELRAAGAEAIAINDKRITTLSEIRNAGQNIMVNGEKITSPFIIQATGDPQVLKSSLLMPGGVTDVLHTWKIQTKLEIKNRLKLPPYRGVLRFNFTKTVNEE